MKLGSSTVQPAQAVQARCIVCHAIEESPVADFRCTRCGELLEISYPWWAGESAIDPQGLKLTWEARRTSPAAIDRSGVWRYRELLPILSDLSNTVTIQEGNTPMYDLPRCASSAGMERLLAKHQGMNPTGSFKDTGMTAALSVAREKGFKWVACASTGNTSASMSAYAARAGMRSLVLIPEGKIAWGKLSQALDYGAVTCQLQGDFDACMRVIAEVVRRSPVYLLNSVNPYRIEGQKTAAIEMLDQLGWEVPDHVIVPGGNLGNVAALGKGFLELRELGFVRSVPKISVIQAQGANALVRTVRETGGARLVPVQAETMATAIRIGNPASWRKAVTVLKTTAGTCEDVTEEELAIAKAEIGSDGVGCEPASAATLAGLKKLVRAGFVKPNDSVVLILTGHVLKDPEYTLKFHRGDLFDGTADSAIARLRRPPIVLEANADAVLRVLERA